MSDKSIKFPGPDHPITIDRNPEHVVVKLGGRVVADTRNALILREASFPSVQYIPREDVDMSLLERSDHTSHCPYKGDASFYSIAIGDQLSKNAVWTYEDPHAAVADIRNRLAFYPDRVDSIEESRP